MNKKLILCAAFLVAAVANTFACTNLIDIEQSPLLIGSSRIVVNISGRLNRHVRPTMSLVI